MNLSDRQQQIQSLIMNNALPQQQDIAQNALDVYQQAYRERLVSALKHHYPVLNQSMGDNAFQQLSLLYLEQHPSSYRSIRWFGNALPDYMATLSNKQSNLVELAQLEWTLTRSFDAPDADTFTIQDMAQFPPNVWHKLRISFQPSVYYLLQEWNTTDHWRAVNNKETQKYWYPQATPCHWLVWRKQFSTYMTQLSDDQQWAFQSAKQGATFADICEGLSHWYPEADVAVQAASILKSWLAAEIVTRIII